jgi:hypothetical protein
MRRLFPVFPNQQTSATPVGMSQKVPIDDYGNRDGNWLSDHGREQPQLGLAAVELNQRPRCIIIGTAAELGHLWTDRVAVPLPIGDLPHGIAARRHHPTRQIEGAGVLVDRNAGAIGAVDHRAVEPLLPQRR